MSIIIIIIFLFVFFVCLFGWLVDWLLLWVVFVDDFFVCLFLGLFFFFPLRMSVCQLFVKEIYMFFRACLLIPGLNSFSMTQSCFIQSSPE